MLAPVAIWHAGLVTVPVNARLHRDEIAYILEHRESAVAATDADPAGDVESRRGPVSISRGRQLGGRGSVSLDRSGGRRKPRTQ